MRWSELCEIVESLKMWSGHDPEIFMGGQDPQPVMEGGWIDLAPDTHPMWDMDFG